MKELSIEEKAKAYDIALDKIKRLLGTGGNCSREDIEYVFPELRESEDERIMKEIIEHIVWSYNFGNCAEEKMQRWIAWLEKQCSQILDNSAKTCKDEQKSIKEHNVCDFCEEKHGCVSPCPTKLVEEQKLVDKVDQHSLPVSDNSSLPTFDESIYHPCSEEVHEQKPTAWSEEDKELMKWSINNLTELKDRFGEDYGMVVKCINWLKSLKDRYTWKPSEEQMDMLAKVCSTLHLTSGENEIMESLYDGLKKLKGE